jgi:thymidylate synthase (FAD)
VSDVCLVGITVPKIPGLNSAEDLVAYAARVSNPSNQMNLETAPKLLRYLMKNKHWSPFEMVSVVMEIKTTRDIARQILRHRSFTFQMFSQRYAKSNLEFEPIEFRLQDNKNRQNSIDDLTPDDIGNYYRRISQIFEDAEHLYSEMVSNGVAKECARNVLPLATKTKLYMNGTLRSWLHFIDLRTGPETQMEHRQIAEECKKIFTKQFPVVSEAMWGKAQEEIQSRLFF